MPQTPNSKNMLVVIHGMGEHSGASVEAEVRQALDGVYDGELDDEVDIRVIAYNKVFNDWRTRASNDLDGAVEALEGRVHFTRVKNLLREELDPGADNFFMTHWLDVVLYMSTLGVRVQLEVARQLTQILQEFNNGGNLNTRKIVLVAHSLGTTVAHDTLHKMWHGGFEDDRYNNLSRMPFAFTAFYQLANTSRLLKTGIDPTSRHTAVRPAPSGMMERMYNVHHRFDPIALVKQFRIDDPGRWLPEQEWPEEVYFPLELEGIHQVNVHALTHYLSDPQVYCNLLNELVDDYVFPANFTKLVKQHKVDMVDAELDKFKAKLDARLKAKELEVVESIDQIARYWKMIDEAQSGAKAKWKKVTAALEAYFDQA